MTVASVIWTRRWPLKCVRHIRDFAYAVIIYGVSDVHYVSPDRNHSLVNASLAAERVLIHLKVFDAGPLLRPKAAGLGISSLALGLHGGCTARQVFLNSVLTFSDFVLNNH